MAIDEIIRAVMGKDEAALRNLLPTTGESSESPSSGCPDCDGGFIHHVDDNGYRYVELCKCQEVKAARKRIASSGLALQMEHCTFASYEAREPWQQSMLTAAQKYAEHIAAGGRSWLYMGGQVGCGKTHLCTAVCGSLLDAGKSVRYIRWPEEVRRIKAATNDYEKLDEWLEPLKDAQVLYIDDFAKSQHSQNEGPKLTDADVRLAFEIFDARYGDRLPTIISSEWPLMSLMDIDQAAFSRVYQMARDYTVNIGPDATKNYRMKGA